MKADVVGDHQLGVAEMDATHREFLDLVNVLNGADNAAFPACSSSCSNIPGCISVKRAG